LSTTVNRTPPDDPLLNRQVRFLNGRAEFANRRGEARSFALVCGTSSLRARNESFLPRRIMVIKVDKAARGEGFPSLVRATELPADRPRVQFCRIEEAISLLLWDRAGHLVEEDATRRDGLTAVFKAAARRTNVAEVREIFNASRLSLLENDFKYNAASMRFRCMKCGHVGGTAFKVVKRGGECPKCSVLKRTRPGHYLWIDDREEAKLGKKLIEKCHDSLRARLVAARSLPYSLLRGTAVAASLS
jgi:rubrerythrin